MYYIATVNVPGYLPTDDDPPRFDTIAEAWQHHVEERNQSWLEMDADGGPDFDPAMAAMGAMITGGDTGTVIAAHTPGYDGDHDLGLAYSVTAAEGILCPACDQVVEHMAALSEHGLTNHLEGDRR